MEISKKLVPATDEVWRLQNGSDPDCRFFQAMAELGHYGRNKHPSTRQGIYICSPSGEFLASINSNDPDRVLQTIQQGLAAWEKLPDHQRRLGENAKIRSVHRWEDSFPKDGLVLTMVTRDLPENGDPNSPCGIKWNQDTVWFSKAEAKSWLPIRPEVGMQYPLPEAIVQRLARCHLVDMVKGQTREFSPSEVQGSEMFAKVVQVEGSKIKIELTGHTRSSSSKQSRRLSPRGVVTRLLGSATFDRDQERFVEFDLIALGRRRGYTEFNDRRRDGASNPVGFVFRLRSPEDPPIAPAFIYAYRADWLRWPAR